MRKNISVTTAISICLSFFLPVISSAEVPNTVQQTTSVSYENYITDNAADSFSDESAEKIDAPLCDKEYFFETPKDGYYEFCLTYTDDKSNGSEWTLYIDGKIPFDEAETICFPTVYRDSDDTRLDGNGNEISPEQIPDTEEITFAAEDRSGAVTSPYLFYLSAGTHTVRIHRNSGNAQIVSMRFCAPKQVLNYKKPEKLSDNEDIITIEAEKSSRKTGRYLIPLSDTSHSQVSPSDPVHGKLNYIGGSNWSSPGDMIEWEFYVKEDGYYSFGAFYRQKLKIGSASYRSLKIDGETPFSEASEMRFTYSTAWRDYVFEDKNGNPYYIWLSKGKHTMSLSVTSGNMAESYALLKQITSDLGDLYVDITMIVGETADNNRSYELFEQIPNFNTRLESAIDSLNVLLSDIKRIQEKNSGTTVSSVNSAIETLQKMLDNPYSAHQYKSAYYTAYTNLGALLGELVDMPLDIDRIYLIGAGAEFDGTKTALFDRIAFSLKRFFFTFSDSYGAVSSESASEELTLWVNWGRDQAQVLTSLINDSFTAETGIGVCVKVVNASLIQGILAGKGPDCVLQMARTEPVNLAMRGALIPLSDFSDFNSVTERFNADGTVPYTYEGDVYALPDTQTFQMMFVRTDILEKHGLSVPKTWDEFRNVVTTLQRSNLQTYMPQTLYLTFLVQSDLPLYDIEEGITTLTQTKQILCFEEYTDWYVRYKVPKTMDSFFNRFRIGAAPIGIADFTMITQLQTAAPEIQNQWIAAELPATVREDGSTSSICAGGGTGCGITKLSENHEKAWKFLKWWTSAETQERYSANLESLLGPLGRVATSNIEAFSQLGWDDKSLDALKSQQKNTKNYEELPGGYYVNRSIEQAFWNVVEANAVPNDTMIKWGIIADNEMKRKITEYAE